MICRTADGSKKECSTFSNMKEKINAFLMIN